MKDIGITYGASILETIALILVGIIIVKILLGITRAVFSKTKVDGSVVSFLQSLIRAAVALVIFFLILRAFQINPTSIAAIIGAGGIAIGFALKDSLSNLASGILVLITKPFKQDDLVQIGGFMGCVSKIKITTTELITADNIKVIIPNNKVISAEIVNHSARPTRRIDVVVNVAYKYDIDMIKGLIHEAAKSEPLALKSPATVVDITALNATSIEYKAKLWVKESDYWTVINRFYSLLLKVFKENNITEARPIYQLVNLNENKEEEVA